MPSIYTNTRFRHECLHDDPYFEMDIGECPECEGKGCDRLHREDAEKIAGEKIVTHFWAESVSPRNFDWCAYRYNDKADDDGHMMQGWGRTEQDAIDDLIAQIEDALGPDDPCCEIDIGECLECEGKGCDRLPRENAEKIAGEKIVTHFWAKPIPPRSFDWCAYRDNDEPDDDGHMMQGWGRTEQDAIDDLIAQIEDARDDGTSA